MPLSPMSKSPRARRLIERRELHLDELRRSAELPRDQLGDLDVEAHQLLRIAGSASTNGAPPSASPPQRKGCCAEATATKWMAARAIRQGVVRWLNDSTKREYTCSFVVIAAVMLHL